MSFFERFHHVTMSDMWTKIKFTERVHPFSRCEVSHPQRVMTMFDMEAKNRKV